ncbi:hypothetical protein BFJ72_g3618 [Fusarium proliferatum]|uniref:NACHT domain-containing protein n=1 Tax=Gibberella intermedia TaxID=948311 RepID=A0A420TUC0_GIBIN|nr:hypothetical protein BFJ72_g3618 [Fusarium proliferatum]
MELSRPADSQIVAASRPRAGHDAILTDEDRKKLQQLKGTSHDSQSIITFTAELDLLDKNRRGKSVASRLASFLQTIEQFTPIVDTYIQSNPDVTALIWGSIKLTFMFLANFASYFQSFVELLHGFGSLCTRFAEYQVIFKESSRLKSSVCQFHTAVVTCCQQIVLAVRRPLRNQILKAITQSFQSELRRYVEDIRAKAEEVQGDIHLAKAQCDREEQQLQTTERKEATDHRKRFRAWAAEMEIFQGQRRRDALEHKRRRLLEDLSSFNFTSAFNSTRNKRHVGTAKWVFDTPEFQQWVKINGPPVLHITGKITLHVPKPTKLTIIDPRSSIVEKLSQIRPPQQFVSFFFARFDDPLSLNAETIIRSCIQQLVSAIEMDTLDQKVVSALDEQLSQARSALFSFDFLSDLCLSAAKAIKQWFIVIDGLDECSTDQQSKLLKFFQGIISRSDTTPNISVVFASRETCTNAIRSIFPESQRVVTGLESTSVDIDSYVDDIIMDKLSTGELVVSDPRLLKEILTTIASKEQGMFLWAFFVIEDICSGKTDNEIRQALQNIPGDLPATFDRALSRIVQKRNQDTAKKAFMWTNATLQPLTLSQLREALSIKPGQHTLRQEDLISGIERLPTWCENLIYVEETDNTVRFSHHSIQEFLLASDSGEHEALHIDPDQCDKLAGEVCITYVNLDNFQTTLAERKRGPQTPSAMKIDPSGIAEQTIQSAIQGSVGTRVGRLARQFVKTSNTKKASTQREFSLSSPMPVTSKAQGTTDYPFLEYASANWFKHTKYISKTEPEIWRLFGQLVQKPSQHSQGEPWHSTKWKDEALMGFPHHDDSRSKCFSDILRAQLSSRIHGIKTASLDVPELSHLLLAFIYAELNDYGALACRSFQLAIELYAFSDELNKLVCILTANKNYMACGNDCASLAPTGLDHQWLVEELRRAIVRGIPYFPALRGNMIRSSCDCADSSPLESKRDICHVLESGYRQVSDPQLQVFAIMVEKMKTKVNIPTISDFERCCLKESAIIEARNTHGMLLLDVLIQWLVESCGLSDINILLAQGSPARLKALSDPIARFMEYIVVPTFTLDGPGSHTSTSILSPIEYTICFLGLLEDGFLGQLPPRKEQVKQYALCGALIKLHGETITTIFRVYVIPTLWTSYIATYIVETLFRGYSLPAPEHVVHAHEDCFREAVWQNNWDIAAALAKYQSAFFDDAMDSGHFDSVREALLCDTCWRRMQNMGRHLASEKMYQYSFKLCEGHNLMFKKITDFRGIHDAKKKTLLCPGHSTDALPEREGRLKWV